MSRTTSTESISDAETIRPSWVCGNSTVDSLISGVTLGSQSTFATSPLPLNATSADRLEWLTTTTSSAISSYDYERVVLLIDEILTYRPTLPIPDVRKWILRGIEANQMLGKWQASLDLAEDYKKTFEDGTFEMNYISKWTGEYKKLTRERALVSMYVAEANLQQELYGDAWWYASQAMKTLCQLETNIDSVEYLSDDGKSTDSDGKGGPADNQRDGPGLAECADLLKRIYPSVHDRRDIKGVKGIMRTYEKHIIPGRVLKAETARRIYAQKQYLHDSEMLTLRIQMGERYGLEYDEKEKRYDGCHEELLAVFEKALVDKDQVMIGTMIQDKIFPFWRNRKSRGECPLYYAIKHNNATITRKCIDLGMAPNAHCTAFSEKLPCKPLSVAMYYRADCAATVLMQNGAVVSEYPHSRGRGTPLHFALKSDDPLMLGLLVDYGLGVDTLDSLGFAPIHWAVQHHKPVMVQWLIEHDADIHVQTRIGKQSPLHLAMREADLATVKMLVVKGADVNKKDHLGMTPLEYAFDSWRFHVKLAGAVECEDYLVENGGVRVNRPGSESYKKKVKEYGYEVAKLPFRLGNTLKSGI